MALLRGRVGARHLVATVVALLISAPSAWADEIDNYWDGVWHSTHHGTALMVMNLEQAKGERKVTGTYRHPREKGGDRGTITAEAKGGFGKTLQGRYKSRSGGGGGGFKIKLLGNLNSWEGEFWPCRYRFYCDVIDWTGNHPEFD